MSNGIYYGIGTALALRGEASPVTQYQLSSEDMSYAKSADLLRTSVAHVRTDLRSIGARIPQTARDGRLIYRMKRLPDNVSLDIIEGENIAKNGIAALESNDVAKARELAESAINICPESPAVQRLYHRVLLHSPNAPLRDILRAARDTSKRATEVRRQLGRLKAIATHEDWSRHREIIATEIDRLHSELVDLTVIRIRTEQRTWPVVRKQEEDREIGELCAMSVMANRMKDRHQEYYRNAIAEHPMVHRLAAELTRKILAMANPHMPIQFNYQDVLTIAIEETARCITHDIDGSAFSVLAELRTYIRKRCGVRTFLLCVADHYGQDPDLVGLVYRKWTFEQKITDAKAPTPSLDIIRKELGLSRPEHEDRYWKMVSTEDAIRGTRYSLLALSRSTGTDEYDGDRLPPEVIAATVDEETILMKMARKVLSEATPDFVELLGTWMEINGELGSHPPSEQEVMRLLKVSTSHAMAFIADLSRLMAVAGEDRVGEAKAVAVEESKSKTANAHKTSKATCMLAASCHTLPVEEHPLNVSDTHDG